MAKKFLKGKNVHLDIRWLMSCMTDLKESSDRENFEKYVLSVFTNHRYLDIIPADVWNMNDRYYERFCNHAELRKARIWKELTSHLGILAEKYNIEQTLVSVLLLLMRLSNPGSRLPQNFSTLDFKDKSVPKIDFSQDEDFMKPVTFSDVVLELESLPSSDDEGDVRSQLGQISTDSGADISPETEVAFHDLLSPNNHHTTHEKHKDWLQENIVNPYWTENTFIATCYSNNQVILRPYQITEQMFMTECIWMLHGIKEVFAFIWNGKSFNLREGIVLAEVSQGTLENVCKKLCECSTFVVEIQSYCSICNKSKTPKIVQAFALALHLELRPLQEQLIKLEKEIIDQEETVTLITLLEVLEPWLNHIRFLWYILQVCIFENPLGSRSGSNQAMHLLSKLHSQLLQTDNIFGRRTQQQFSTLVTLFLETCGPFLDFVDQLLNCGEINDPHNEFIIEKRIIEKTEDEISSQNVLVLSDIPKYYTSNCFLFQILEKVILAASLVASLKNIIPWTDSEPNSLSDMFINQCYQKIGLPHPRMHRDNYFRTTLMITNTSANVDSTVLISSLDPMLKGYFQDIFPINNGSTKKEMVPDEPLNAEVSGNNSINEARTLKILLEETLLLLVFERCGKINRKALDVMKGELCIKDHMQAIGNYFLFKDGESMKQFVSDVFKKILNHESWKSSEQLNLLFRMSVRPTDSTSKHIHRLTPILKESNTTVSKHPLEELSHLSLNYSAPSPINIILNSENLIAYQKVFCFLMKLNCAKYSLDNLRFNDLEDWSDWKCSNIVAKQFLYLFRLNLLHFMNQLQYYFMIGVLHDKQGQFLHSLDSAEGFQEALSLHQNHLNNLQRFCLLSNPSLFLQMSNLFNLVVFFTRNWNSRTLKSGMKKMVLLETEFHSHLWGLSKVVSLFWRSPLFDGRQNTDLGVLSNLLVAQTRLLRPSYPLEN